MACGCIVTVEPKDKWCLIQAWKKVGSVAFLHVPAAIWNKFNTCPALPCPALPRPAPPCPALPCPTLPCPALPCPALPFPALPNCD